MSDTKKSSFQTSMYNVEKMRDQAEARAKDLGFTKRGEIDAFRHAYTSAKMREAYGEDFATTAGESHEIATNIHNRGRTFFKHGNPNREWDMDLHNNKVGRDIQRHVSALNIPEEDKEKRLQEDIAAAVKKGRLQTDPNAPKAQNKPEEDKASILDYFKKEVGGLTEDVKDALSRIFLGR